MSDSSSALFQPGTGTLSCVTCNKGEHNKARTCPHSASVTASIRTECTVTTFFNHQTVFFMFTGYRYRYGILEFNVPLDTV